LLLVGRKKAANINPSTTIFSFRSKLGVQYGTNSSQLTA